MPLTGTGDVLGALIMTMQDAARDAYLAGKPLPLTPVQTQELRVELAKAQGRAIIAHLVAVGTGAVAVAAVMPGTGVATGSLV